MLTSTIGTLGMLLQGLLLLRGLQSRLIREFPVFYSYLLFVFLQDFVRAGIRFWFPEAYFGVYWTTQFIGLVLGSAVILEVYRVALRAFPGTAKMARYLLLVVFGAIFARALMHASKGFFGWVAQSSEMVEWSLRAVQGVALLTLVTLFLWYAIPFGRNLKGILWGYGLFVGMSIIQFTLMYFAYEKVLGYWNYAQPASYLLVLGVWTSTLWSRHAVPEMARDSNLENDYESLVATTRSQLGRALARLGWAERT